VGEIDEGALVSRRARRKRTRGWLERRGDGNGEVPGAIVSASEKSLASSLLPRFQKGTSRCSGGVSMRGSSCRAASGRRSRSLGLTLRDAQVLILDEPTASLDAAQSTKSSFASRSWWRDEWR